MINGFLVTCAVAAVLVSLVALTLAVLALLASAGASKRLVAVELDTLPPLPDPRSSVNRS